MKVYRLNTNLSELGDATTTATIFTISCKLLEKHDIDFKQSFSLSWRKDFPLMLIQCPSPEFVVVVMVVTENIPQIFFPGYINPSLLIDSSQLFNISRTWAIGSVAKDSGRMPKSMWML